MLKIALFSYQEKRGCTSMSVHLANFLASDEKNDVAFIEEKVPGRGTSFTFAKNKEEDGTYRFNHVHFYPLTVEKTPTEQIQVFDIGQIGILYKFDTYDKIYLCTDGTDDDWDSLAEYREDHPDFTPDILLFGASKECVRKWGSIGKTVLIGNQKETVIPQNFSMMITPFLYANKISVPIYHKDKIYAKIPFGAEDLPEEEPEEEPEAPEKEKAETELSSGLGVRSKVERADGDIDYVTVPVPGTITEPEPEPAPEPKPAPKAVREKPSVKDTLHELGQSAGKLANGFIKAHKKKAEEKKEPEALRVGSFYDQDKLFFDKCFPSKDLSKYSVLTTKRQSFIGLSDHIKSKKYDNSDRTLIDISEGKGELVQFLTQDILSGEYNLSRFSEEESASMRFYFLLINEIFESEIGKTVDISEYLEFKGYYNRLCEMKFMLEREWQERERRCHDLYERFRSYMYLYGMEIQETEHELYENEADPFLRKLAELKKSHLYDDVSILAVDQLIDEFKTYAADYGVAEPVEADTSDTGDTDDTSASSEASDTEAPVQPAELPDIKPPYRDMKFFVTCADGDGHTDRAVFAYNNLNNAVIGFLHHIGYVKTIGVIIDDKDYGLFSSKNGSVMVPLVLENAEIEKNIEEIRQRMLLLLSAAVL